MRKKSVGILVAAAAVFTLCVATPAAAFAHGKSGGSGHGLHGRIAPIPATPAEKAVPAHNG
jgi:hypothetical protein